MKKNIIRLIILFALILALYGLGRLYYRVTGGFMVSNITSDFAFQPSWEVRPLLQSEIEEFDLAVNQPYHYLEKGCQSYVFASEDNRYVIKFFKYQRYRIQPWLAYFPPLPAVVKYREEKMAKKWHKLDGFVRSWKIAFDHLKKETGLVYVHLNKTNHLQRQVTLFDKIGKKHVVSLDHMEFCIQKKADLLQETLLDYRDKADDAKAKELIYNLLHMILSEYARGFADNDHALMQNTAVANGLPVHIDVGQFVFNEQVKQPAIFHQELFTKTYELKIWLKKHYPEIGTYLDEELQQIIGADYSSMQPK